MLTGICADGSYWAPKTCSVVHRAYERNDHSRVVIGLGEPQIVLLLYGLDPLAKGSGVVRHHPSELNSR